MSAFGTCSVCGTALPPDAPKGFCPRCLYRLGFEELAELPPPDQQPSADSLFEDAAAPDLAKVRHFGDYQLLEEIGRGGMGVVYKARQESLDRIVALKLLLFGPQAPPESVKRFRAEASATAALQHPNIVAIHEVGVCQGQHYLAMDYVEGPSLAWMISDLRFQISDWRRAVSYLKTIAEAVHYAHQCGILHRDLKPANILIDANDQPRVTDFGLAKRLTDSSLSTLHSEQTVSGQVLGSPNYMPPEQAIGKRGKVSRRSDVYALGAILYHALTGRPPFVGEGPADTVQQVLNTEPVSPRALNPRLHVDLETICLKCLEKEPDRRYATALALADDLGRWLEREPILARPLGPVGKAWRWCRRNPRLALATSAALLSLTLGMVGVTWQWRAAKAQQARAEAAQQSARQNAYASDMLLAQHALAAGNPWLTESLLDKHRPRNGFQSANLKSQIDRDLRGWEWRHLWQLCQAGESVRLQPNPGWIGAMAIAQDGRVLAAQTGANRIAIWDLMSKRMLNELRTSDRIDSLRLSSAGNLLAVSARNAEGEPTVEVWDLSAREIRRTLSNPSSVRSLAFSPDGRLLATFDSRGGIRLVEWATDHTVTNFPVPPPRHGGAGLVEFSPDGSRLAIGEDYGRIRLLNWRTGSVVTITNLTPTGSAVTALACSPNSDVFAAGFGDVSGLIHFYDANSGERRGQLIGHKGEVWGLAFTPDGQRLASAGADRTLRVWRIADQAELHSSRGHEGEGMVLAFLPDGRTLASGCEEGLACLWDLTATRAPLSHTTLTISYGVGSQTGLEAPSFASASLDPKTVRRFGFAFTPDGQRFITTDREGTLGVWETRSVRCVEWLIALGSNHWGVALSPEGNWLAAGSTSGKVNIWDWTDRHLVTTLTIPFQWFGDLRFSRSGRFLFVRTVRNDQTPTVRIWRTDDWGEVGLVGIQSLNLYSVDLSPDDRLLATGYGDGVVRLAPFPSGGRETTILKHAGAVTALLFSPEGRVLAVAGGRGEVRLWNLVTGRELPILRGHSDWVWSAAFSPDGRRLATSGYQAADAVKLWDIATQREILALQGEGEFFFQIACSPDESTLATTSATGVTHLWRAPSWEEIRAAENGGVPR